MIILLMGIALLVMIASMSGAFWVAALVPGGRTRTGWLILGAALLALACWQLASLFSLLDQTDPFGTAQILSTVLSLLASILAGVVVFWLGREALRVMKLEKKTRSLVRDAELNDRLLEQILDLSGEQDLNHWPERALNSACRLANTDQGFIGLVEPGKAVLEVKQATGIFRGAIGVRLKPGEDLAGRVWQTGRALAISRNNGGSSNGHGSREIAVQGEDKPNTLGQNISAALGLPLVDSERVVGVIGLVHTQEGRCFSETEMDRLLRFSRAASLLLQQARQLQARDQSLAGLHQQVDWLQYRLRLERMTAVMSSHFIHIDPERIDEAISQVLQSLGRGLNVDRGYLVLFPASSKEKILVREWCAPGIPEQSVQLQHLVEDGFSWWMRRLLHMETILVNRLADLPPEAEDVARGLAGRGVKSLVVTPLTSGRETKGMLGFEVSRKEMTWSPEMVGLVKLLGEMFSNVLEQRNSALEANRAKFDMSARITDLERFSGQVEQITEMGELLQACRTADEAYPIIARTMRRLTPAASGCLYLIRSAQDPADKIVSWGERPTSQSENELVMNSCWGLRRGRAYVISDMNSGPVCEHLSAPYPASYLCVPLIAHGETIGLLHLRVDGAPAKNGGSSKVAACITDYQDIAIRVSEHLSTALANLNMRDELRSQAIRDPLTGLFNRRYMEATLDRELRRAGRHGTSVSVIMFDIDRLKPINDTLGHDAGDYLLKSLGAVMLKLFRGEDVACRYGGDEFTVILPEATITTCWQRAEQLRESFKKMSLEYDGRTIGPVSMSIGIGSFPEHGTSADRLIQACDAAAYAAKGEGGDRVMIARSAEDA
jgi:diguanylate cyclase (GGDEF)-like protein